ncbi:MAG: DUF550 domain-containing protein [Oscillospiraceae bacterium]|jgi:hypothetical protein|nr:DUF550 domain-containing protein [Oscillospiraceae bacterium]
MDGQQKKDIAFEEMFALQRALHDAHPDWGGLPPELAQSKLLWAFEEMGEIVAIFKKKGYQEILGQGGVRSCFLEEVCDVLMYLNDMMLALGVTPEEIAGAYRGKFRYNLKRDWESQNQVLFTHSDLEDA